MPTTESLRKAEETFRFVIEKMTDIIWTTDKNLRTVYVSPSIKTVLGFDPEERVLQEVSEQVTPASMSLIRESMTRELALEDLALSDPDRTVTLEVEYYHKDGSTRCLENIICGIRDERGVLTGFHGLSRDVKD